MKNRTMKNRTYKKYFYFLVLLIMAALLWTGCGKNSDSEEISKEEGTALEDSLENEKNGQEDNAQEDNTQEDSAEENNIQEENLQENNQQEEKQQEHKPEKEAEGEQEELPEAASPEEEPKPEVYTGETEGLETVRTTARVNVRMEPSLEGAVYTKLPNRTELSRIQDEGEWSAVYYDGYLLYIASAYLRTKPDGNGAGGSGGEAGASGDGYVIVIDPGHQAHANTNKEPVGPGASEMKNKVAGGTRGTATGLAEYELTLQVSEKIRDELEARGYIVVMTRESHDVDLSNSERAVIANENQADAFIRIHANGSNDSSVNGVMTICQTPSNPYNADWYAESRRLSDYVLDEVTAATGAKKQYVWETDTMTGINWAQVPSTILEMGYMTNADEDRRMASDDYQDTIAEAVADAVDLFLQE